MDKRNDGHRARQTKESLLYLSYGSLQIEAAMYSVSVTKLLCNRPKSPACLRAATSRHPRHSFLSFGCGPEDSQQGTTDEDPKEIVCVCIPGTAYLWLGRCLDYAAEPELSNHVSGKLHLATDCVVVSTASPCCVMRAKQGMAQQASEKTVQKLVCA
ncbi:hypothetical protein IF1G_05047 [Cordyceps javanica]|uniref:Uncharacterized protein n=1 Tax=Cordyceps javanica TaxID=43265 RepID=A0A545V435_9HYPO|nr:hypothetical protein IF1G_05047 [Cordyceps javanica]